MRFCFRVVTVLAVLGLTSSAFSARADEVIVGNLNQTPDDGSPAIITPYIAWAQEFTSGSAVTLANAYASLGEFDAGNDGSFSITATLYCDSGLSGNPYPSTAIETFTQVTNMIPSSGFANIEFTLSTPVALAADTGYWFVVSGASDNEGSGGDEGGVGWQYTGSDVLYGLPGSTLPNYSTDYPVGWSENANAGYPFLFEADVECMAVPEPSSLLLGYIGLTAAMYIPSTCRSSSRRHNRFFFAR